MKFAAVEKFLNFREVFTFFLADFFASDFAQMCLVLSQHLSNYLTISFRVHGLEVRAEGTG